MGNLYYRKRKNFCNKNNFCCNRQNCLKIFSPLKIIKRLFYFLKSDPFLIVCKQCGHINIFHSRKTNPNLEKKRENLEYVKLDSKKFALI